MLTLFRASHVSFWGILMYHDGLIGCWNVIGGLRYGVFLGLVLFPPLGVLRAPTVGRLTGHGITTTTIRSRQLSHVVNIAALTGSRYGMFVLLWFALHFGQVKSICLFPSGIIP